MVPMHRAGRSLEEVFPIIGAMWPDTSRDINAVNVPNRGYVPNLPEGAIVEVPAAVDANGVAPVEHASDRRSVGRVDAGADRASGLGGRGGAEGRSGPAFEALRRDPLSPRDEASCRKMFDELMSLQGEALPF